MSGAGWRIFPPDWRRPISFDSRRCASSQDFIDSDDVSSGAAHAARLDREEARSRAHPLGGEYGGGGAVGSAFPECAVRR